MEFWPITRAPGAFQQSVTPEGIEAICRRAFGTDTQVVSAAELGTGTYDFDRTWWGDPAADWTIRMVRAKSDERQTFWDTYGLLDQSEAAAWRSKIYEARHLGAIRLERHRLGNSEGVRNSYEPMAQILAAVA
ncbi:hypothetical protein ACFV0C_19450 [Streptomyces sp. NPDC059568]|uniref:hypothetical protein n=1 Tax=Streptomyces sp. NPDC059568 TaxID=3346868 RepID=UPI0036BA2918